MKQKQTARVISQRETAPSIFDMWIETSLAEQAKPGQFLCIYPKDRSTLLPRPISICEVREDRQALRIVYRIAGAGTTEFSGYQAGDTISILGTLGNGFPLDEAEGKKVFLMGGGIGVPPILELAKQMKADKQIIMGYRDSKTFLKEETILRATFSTNYASSSDARKNNIELACKSLNGAIIDLYGGFYCFCI